MSHAHSSRRVEPKTTPGDQSHLVTNGESPKRCLAIPIQSQPPKSPCPDLLLNNLTPTDFQLHQIRKSIQGADEDIRRLQDAIDQLSTQIGALQSFVERHRGVASAVRRLPSEILFEIFTHSLNTNRSSFHPKNALTDIIRVCARWRAVALASPLLWRHFVFDSELSSGKKAKVLQKTSLQLQWSGQTPLSVQFLGNLFEVDLLGTLLAVSSRWQSATLRLPTGYYDRLFTSRVDFTILKELTLKFEYSLCIGDATVFVSSLPSLVDLTLHMGFNDIPCGFKSIWAQLLECTLVQCNFKDILPILPLFSTETRLSIRGCDSRDRDLAPVQLATSILSQLAIPTLLLDSWYDKCFTDFLGAVAAPRLKTFVVREPHHSPRLLQFITTFLGNSSCTLTHLALRKFTSLPDLLTLLKLPQTRHIFALDIDLMFIPYIPIIDALAKHDIVSNLRSLTLRNSESVGDAGVLALHASRRPTLQQLWLQRRTNELPLSQTALQALKSDGLEVVIFEQLDYW
ncbi:hypothetical protein GGX14DRAFT_587395 [Mycena pura]|uniref:F-box domain-containing protein n=1 Tax=Mycena pura TaxID=153505 RepID=A0AAD6Y0X5_9AGAR|nr:hypothetical protein GGX14DRAFT_587395 [Mycena pura]